MSDIIAAVGRLRIKKKGETIPFRQTLAFRLLLLAGAMIASLLTSYRAIAAARSSDTPVLVIFGAAAVLSAIASFHNLNHLKDARLSPTALKRMKRKI